MGLYAIDIKSFLDALDTNTLLNKIEIPSNLDVTQSIFLEVNRIKLSSGKY